MPEQTPAQEAAQVVAPAPADQPAQNAAPMPRVGMKLGANMTEDQKAALRAKIWEAQNRDIIAQGGASKCCSSDCGEEGHGAHPNAPGACEGEGTSGPIQALEERNVQRRAAAARQEQELDDQLKALYRYKETLEKTNKERREKRQKEGKGEVQSKTQELKEKVEQVMAIEGPPASPTPAPEAGGEKEPAARDPLMTPPSSPTPGQAPPSPQQADAPPPTFTPKGVRGGTGVNPPPTVMGDTSRAEQLKARGGQMKARLHEEPGTTVEELQSQVKKLQEDNTMMRQVLSSVLVNLKNSGSLASAVELML